MSNKRRSKRIWQIVLLSGTAVSLFFVPWILIKAWILPLPETVDDQVRETLDYGFEGIIVYVDQRKRPPAFYAAGWHNRESKIPAYPSALFKIASIGKLYDAVAITRLTASKRLSLDNTLSYYFSMLADKIENAESITLRMMVQHRSGIPNITDTPDFWTNPPKNSDEALERILGMSAEFEPDARYQYSNTNYLLIGKLIQKVTGKNKFDFINAEILAPLELRKTFGSLKDINTDSLMSGYYVGAEEDIKTADYGSMIATAEDVGKFLRALNDGTIFRTGEREIYSSIYQYNHTGLIPGYQSIAKYHDDLDAVVVQFVNTTNFDGYEWNLSEIIYNRVIKIIRQQNGV